jgi:hypothetical protein
LGVFISYEKNEVLWIQPRVCIYKTFYELLKINILDKGSFWYSEEAIL